MTDDLRPLQTDDLLTADPLTADPLTADPLTADPLTADPLPPNDDHDYLPIYCFNLSHNL